MDLESASSQNVASDNSFFYMEGSHVFIVANGEKVNLNFDQITNVRLIKNRNLSLNLILFFVALLLYSYYILFFNNHFLIQVGLLILITSFIAASMFVKLFSYKLLVNKGVDGFNEFLVSKSNLPFANSFIYIFKDRKGDKSYTHSSIFNYVA
jgi:hypothetical protein